MIRDRGKIKFTAFMMPEHVHLLKETIVEENKAQKPLLDEQAIEEFELIVCEAIALNNQINIEVFNNGFLNAIKGKVHFINHLKRQLILQDEKGFFHHIPFNNLVNIIQE